MAEITIKSLRIFTKDLYVKQQIRNTIHLNKFEFVEAEIATHKRNWRDGLAFPADISLRINRLDIGIKRFTACSKILFL